MSDQTNLLKDACAAEIYPSKHPLSKTHRNTLAQQCEQCSVRDSHRSKNPFYVSQQKHLTIANRMKVQLKTSICYFPFFPLRWLQLCQKKGKRNLMGNANTFDKTKPSSRLQDGIKEHHIFVLYSSEEL